MSTIHVTWLRLAWTLAAFVPLAVISTPILAIRIGGVFIACLMYLWPVTMLANTVDLLEGEPPFGPWHIALAAIYCALVGAAVAWALTSLLRLPAYIPRTRALVLIAVIWVPVGAFVSYQVLQYKGVFARRVDCPGTLYILQRHCTEIRDLRVHTLEGFIDASYLATFRTSSDVLRTIATTNLIPEADPASLPDSLWKQPPVWWATSKTSAAHVYMTPGFSFDSREGDGDYYLFIEDRRSGEVFALLHANF